MRKPDWFAGLIAAACFALGSIWVAAQSPSLQAPPGVYIASVTLSAPGQVNLPTPYTGPAGEYKFTATVPVTISKTDTSYTISWSPTPVPPPVPPIPPGPITGVLYVYAVFDKTAPAPTVDQLALQKSTTIAKALSDLGDVKWAAIDIGSPTFAAWAPDVPKETIPALVVIWINANGKGSMVPGYPVRLAEKNTEAWIVSEVKQVRGK